MSDSSGGGFLRSTLTRAVSFPLRVYRTLRPLGDGLRQAVPSPSTPSNPTSFNPPSPLTYLTSSYLVLSLSLAFLLHRIHHLVPPAHRPTDPRDRDRTWHWTSQVACRLPGILFMLKASVQLVIAAASLSSSYTSTLSNSPRTRFWLGGLQAATVFTGKGELGKYLISAASSKPIIPNHSSLLWQTFLSISLSITCETFVRALSDDSPSLHSFNLLSFSFLLHVQSHPASLSSGSPSAIKGENYQLYLYLLLTLLELISLQCSYLVPYFLLPFKKLSSLFSSRSRSRSQPDSFHSNRTTQTRPTKKYRFAITLFYSLLSQYLALRSYYSFYTHLSSPPLSPTSQTDSDSVATQGGGGGGALIWFNKLPELGFELLVLLSIFLKTLAALIRGEEMNRDNLVGAPVWWDSTEDYAVVLIKYTTALLRATRLSTLSYELSPLSVLPSSIATSLESIGFDLSNASSTSTDALGEGGGEGEGGLRVRLERNGDVVLIEELERESRGTGLRRRTGVNTTEALTYGFGVEVKKVEVEPQRNGLNGGGSFEGGIEAEWDGDWGNGFGMNESVEYTSGRREGEVGIGLIQGERRGWIWRFTAVVLRMVFYLGYVAVVFAKRTIRTGLRVVGLRSLEGRLKDTWTTREEETAGRLRRRRGRSRSVIEGEEEDESDDEDWKPGEDEGGDSSAEGESDDDEMEEEEEPKENALALFSDLSESLENESVLTPTDLAPYLLAHHLSPSTSSQSPLTRRRYQSLLPSSSSRSRRSPTPENQSSLDQLDSAVSTSLRASPHLLKMTREEREAKREEWRESRSAFCVVCTVEPRTIILWPCRCLVLCEACRDALALRTQASTPGDGGAGAGTGGSLCPTCRVGVAGFSRIYIP